MVTVSFVPDVAQCTAAARVFPELARWRWTRFAEGSAAVLAVAALARWLGPGPWLVGSLAAVAVTFWSLLTVFGPWYAPRRLRRTFWIDELVTCRITEDTLVWWSQPGVRELPWHTVEAVGTRGGVLALRTGRPYELIWLPLALVTAEQVAAIVRRAASMGADTRSVDLSGVRSAGRPEPVGIPAGSAAGGLGSDLGPDLGGGGRPGGRPGARSGSESDGWADADGWDGERSARAEDWDGQRPTRFERPAIDAGDQPIEITGRITRRQAITLFRNGRMTDRSPVVGLLAGAATAAVLVLLPAGMGLLPDLPLGLTVGPAAALVCSSAGGLAALVRALARRVAAGRYLVELGDEPGVWLADGEGITTVTRAGRTFSPWTDVVDGRLDDGMLVVRFYGRRRRVGVPVDGCTVTEVDRLLCWLGTAGVWILAF